MKQYTVKQLADLAGISVRTLHYYDDIHLLTPAERSEAGYRLYGESELLRLQQILFYRELDVPLNEIGAILDDPGFNKVRSLRAHKVALVSRKERLSRLINTIDNTIANLRKDAIMTPEELYEGFPREQAEAWRQEALDRWGPAVEDSERYLQSLGKEQFDALKEGFAACWKRLAGMHDRDPESPEVQAEVERHYGFIRQFWGVTDPSDIRKEQYIELGELYKADPRYTTIDGVEQPGLGEFMSQAMQSFARQHLE